MRREIPGRKEHASAWWPMRHIANADSAMSPLIDAPQQASLLGRSGPDNGLKKYTQCPAVLGPFRVIERLLFANLKGARTLSSSVKNVNRGSCLNLYSSREAGSLQNDRIE